MFFDFRKIIKSTNSRGWSLQKENDTYYLSKFDDGLNDDEFRFFILETENGLEISHMDKVKHSHKHSNPKILAVKNEHPLAKKAQDLVDMHPLNRKTIHNK